MQFEESTGRLLIPGLFNTRDLGGMKTKSGRITAFHHLIRSDALDHLKEPYITELSSFGVSVIIDLRSQEEAEAHPDTLRDDPRFTYYNIPLLRVNADDMNNQVISDCINSSLGDLYIWMFQNSRPYFAEVLRTIRKEKDRTILFHCAHGKDRTGLISAIFYLLLGVDRKDIISNYAISYTYVKELVAPLIRKNDPRVHHIYRSDAKNMEMLLSYLDKEYDGDIRKFLSLCGLSEEEIASLTSILL